jgi:hypothetical protein
MHLMGLIVLFTANLIMIKQQFNPPRRSPTRERHFPFKLPDFLHKGCRPCGGKEEYAHFSTLWIEFYLIFTKIGVILRKL